MNELSIGEQANEYRLLLNQCLYFLEVNRNKPISIETTQTTHQLAALIRTSFSRIENDQLKSADLLIKYGLEIDCPNCGSELDLSDHDEDQRFSGPIFNHRWEEVEGKSVFCPDCDKDFTISNVHF